LGSLVALGEKRPRDEKDLQRRNQRQGRRVRVGRQQGRWPGAHGNRGVGCAFKVAIKLDFVKPFETHNIVEFTLEPKSRLHQRHLDHAGPHAYISKLITVFVNMDSMVGKDFEAGLANLKAVAENQPR